MSYVVCYRRPDKQVDTRECPSLASVFGVMAHLCDDFEQVWVRENPGGSIILVYDARASLQRP